MVITQLFVVGRFGTEKNLPDFVVAVQGQSPPPEHHILRVRQKQNVHKRNQRKMRTLHEGKSQTIPKNFDSKVCM